MKNNAIIFYHKEDNDGVVSAALLFNYLSDTFDDIDSIDLVGLDYNDVSQYSKEVFDELKEIYSQIFITDISFPIQIMEYAYMLWGKNMYWFDHHKPIIDAVSHSKKIDNVIFGERCIDRSAILCVWKCIYDPFDINHNDIPELLRILSGWDSFTYEKEGYELDYVKNVNDGFTDICELNVMKTSQILKENLEEYKEKALNIGKIINQHEKQVFKTLIPQIGDCTWKVIEKDGTEHTACCIVYGGKTNSLMFDSVKDEVECGIVLKKNKDNTWVISLYNTNNDNKSFHCGQFLRDKYNGGGHQGAAGAQVKQTKIINILKNHQI